MTEEKRSQEKYAWEELPFVDRKTLWNPEKLISAKCNAARHLIGEEFALSYLRLIKEKHPQAGLVRLFFIAQSMTKGSHFNNHSGIERAFFDEIDRIIRVYCLDRISFDAIKKRTENG